MPEIHTLIENLKGLEAKATKGRCRRCGVKLELAKTGRPKYFCNDVCRAAFNERTEKGKVKRHLKYLRLKDSPSFKEAKRKQSRKQYWKFPYKAIARAMVGNAVKNGFLKRPNKCEECKRVGHVSGHHHKGYETAHILDVQWLCQKCHQIKHPRKLTRTKLWT